MVLVEGAAFGACGGGDGGGGVLLPVVEMEEGVLSIIQKAVEVVAADVT